MVSAMYIGTRRVASSKWIFFKTLMQRDFKFKGITPLLYSRYASYTNIRRSCPGGYPLYTDARSRSPRVCIYIYIACSIRAPFQWDIRRVRNIFDKCARTVYNTQFRSIVAAKVVSRIVSNRDFHKTGVRFTRAIFSYSTYLRFHSAVPGTYVRNNGSPTPYNCQTRYDESLLVTVGTLRSYGLGESFSHIRLSE